MFLKSDWGRVKDEAGTIPDYYARELGSMPSNGKNGERGNWTSLDGRIDYFRMNLILYIYSSQDGVRIDSELP